MANLFFKLSKIPLLHSPAPFFFCGWKFTPPKKKKKTLVQRQAFHFLISKFEMPWYLNFYFFNHYTHKYHDNFFLKKRVKILLIFMPCNALGQGAPRNTNKGPSVSSLGVPLLLLLLLLFRECPSPRALPYT
jgi:hypothetical protein